MLILTTHKGPAPPPMMVRKVEVSVASKVTVQRAYTPGVKDVAYKILTPGEAEGENCSDVFRIDASRSCCGWLGRIVICAHWAFQFCQ